MPRRFAIIPITLRLTAVFALSSVAIAACSSSSDSMGPVADAGIDGTVASDAAVDASDAAIACAPQPLGSFTPTFHAAAGTYQNVCSEAELENLNAQCYGPSASTSSCTTATAALPAACNTCVFGLPSADPGPAILEFSDFVDRNLGACVGLLTGDSSPTSCAAKVEAAYQCGVAACGSACPIVTQADFVAQNKCVTAANAYPNECESYADAAYGTNGCANTLPTAVTSVCFESIANGAITTVLLHYTQLFCGPPPDDAGLDGGTDAD